MEFEFTKKLLLVNDDPDILDRVKMVLEKESKSIDVISASSSSMALKILEKENFDVIVSDYQMSEMDSIEFLKKVRGEKEMEMPFIFFTEKRTKKIVLKALKTGANRVVHKGNDVMMSCKVLNQALKQEMLHYVRKKELERHRKKFNSNIIRTQY